MQLISYKPFEIQRVNPTPIGAGTKMTIRTGTTTTNTKTAWTEIIASTPFDAHGFYWFFGKSTTTGVNSNYHALYDLAIGSSGNEVPILENWYHHYGYPYLADEPVFIEIPAGSRLSFRWQQSSGQSIQMTAGIYLFQYSNFTGASRKYTTLNASTATSKGTTITTATFSPPWNEIIASCPTDLTGIMVRSYGNAWMWWNLGIGGSGSETPIFKMNSEYGQFGSDSVSFNQRYDIQIPAGSRLSVRARGGATSAHIQLIGLQ